ncbi:MAG: T9SS type A sorting domain-containing protein [Chitinophagaceae bacterium]
MRVFLVFLLTALNYSAVGQVNLVPNGDFETLSRCPEIQDQIDAAVGWGSIYVQPLNISCLPDYCHTCNNNIPQSTLKVPLSRAFYQNPHSGNGMVQMAMYWEGLHGGLSQYHDYLQAKLTAKLKAGKRYCVSYYVNLEEGSTYAVNEIDAYFDNGTIDTSKNCEFPHIPSAPQIRSGNTVYADTMKWVKIEGSFIAVGTETHITIGNFYTDAQTVIAKQPHNAYTDNFGAVVAAYLIDDISVVESTTLADAGPNTHVGAGDSVYIGRPMASAIWCDWRVLGSNTIIGQGPGIKVKPSVATSYVVTQNLCGNITTDTVRVAVWPAGVNSVNGKEQVYWLSPNPVLQTLHLSQKVKDERAVWVSVYEATGKRVYSGNLQFADSKAVVDVSQLAAGFYFVELKDGSGNRFRLKMVKK